MITFYKKYMMLSSRGSGSLKSTLKGMSNLLYLLSDSFRQMVPKVFVWAPVCRPGWLVEMECMAMK